MSSEWSLPFRFSDQIFVSSYLLCSDSINLIIDISEKLNLTYIIKLVIPEKASSDIVCRRDGMHNSQSGMYAVYRFACSYSITKTIIHPAAAAAPAHAHISVPRGQQQQQQHLTFYVIQMTNIRGEVFCLVSKDPSFRGKGKISDRSGRLLNRTQRFSGRRETK
jgi:hypothetical protein